MQFILIDQNTKRHFLDNILDCIQKIDIATMKSPNVFLKKLPCFFKPHDMSVGRFSLCNWVTPHAPWLMTCQSNGKAFLALLSFCPSVIRCAYKYEYSAV